MPFITIELSQNTKLALTPFASDLHHYLAPLLDVPIGHFKTKLVYLEHVVVGDGRNSGFARLKIELKEGRSRNMLKNCLEEILRRFSQALRAENPHLSCRVTAEFCEIDPEFLVATSIS